MRNQFKGNAVKTTVRALLIGSVLATSTYGLAFQTEETSVLIDLPAQTSDRPNLNEEFVLRLNYQVACDPETPLAPQVILGDIHFLDRTVRVELYEARHTLEIFLGPLPERSSPRSPFLLYLHQSSNCALQGPIRQELLRYNLTITPATMRSTTRTPIPSADVVEKLALKYAPYIIVRPDQTWNRRTDVPLLTTYTTYIDNDNPEQFLIQYMTSFTDEDSLSTAAAEEEHRVAFGRSTDIEWPARVFFNRNLELVKIEYQGREHHVETFDGQFIPHTLHPIVYNHAPVLLNQCNNNVFTDDYDHSNSLQIHAARQRIGHHLVPRLRLNPGEPVEKVNFLYPELNVISDQELRSEGKLTRPFNEFLYIWMRGRLGGVHTHPDEVSISFRRFWLRFDFDNSPWNDPSSQWSWLWTGPGELGVYQYNSRYETDLITAVRMSPALLNSIQRGSLTMSPASGAARGRLRFESANSFGAFNWAETLRIDNLRFYVPNNHIGDSFTFDEVTTDHFDCHYDRSNGFNTYCGVNQRIP